MKNEKEILKLYQKALNDFIAKVNEFKAKKEYDSAMVSGYNLFNKIDQEKPETKSCKDRPTT